MFNILRNNCVLQRIHIKRGFAKNEPILDYKKGTTQYNELKSVLNDMNSKVHKIPIIIAGKEYHTDDIMYQKIPSNHNQNLAQYCYADKILIKLAINTAVKAQKEWSLLNQTERSKIFEKAADLVSGKYRAQLLSSTMLGQGKTIFQAEIDAACELADFYRFHSEWAKNLSKTQPISLPNVENKMFYRGMEGFWAAICPFNFTAISGNLSGTPAMLGNGVVWKPSDTSVHSSYLIIKILMEAGLPDGVINFVPADGKTFGKCITKMKGIRWSLYFFCIIRTFTTLWKDVADNIDKYTNYPRLIGGTLFFIIDQYYIKTNHECGGKNYHLIHESAKKDIDAIVYDSCRSAFEYSGQKCSACSRIYIPSNLWNPIKDKFIESMKKIKLGDVLDDDTFLSSVIDEKSFDRINKAITSAKSDPECTIICGGDTDKSKGYYIQPTLIQTKNPNHNLLKEELFGPVLAVYVYEPNDWDTIIALINKSKHALTGSIYCYDKNILNVSRKLLVNTTGNFYINNKSTGSVVGQQPFGGARKSGTNDKAGSPYYVTKFTNILSVKRTFKPTKQLLND
ncbi:L-glutamate gamma-semialdehyde dehydrogenase [Intoshia linei]|uniref:Multifunctional fusion protein n=1 Tax=Intoshia linei TaxID=1819745 RepID=A0A177B376_9BILA|nr:L-glutamate gamma-semialdehyde dehydrogenase [Intoshia linei]